MSIKLLFSSVVHRSSSVVHHSSSRRLLSTACHLLGASSSAVEHPRPTTQASRPAISSAIQGSMAPASSHPTFTIQVQLDPTRRHLSSSALATELDPTASPPTMHPYRRLSSTSNIKGGVDQLIRILGSADSSGVKGYVYSGGFLAETRVLKEHNSNSIDFLLVMSKDENYATDSLMMGELLSMRSLLVHGIKALMDLKYKLSICELILANDRKDSYTIFEEALEFMARGTKRTTGSETDRQIVDEIMTLLQKTKFSSVRLLGKPFFNKLNVLPDFLSKN